MTRLLLVGVVALASCGPRKPPPPTAQPATVDAAPAPRGRQAVLLVTRGNQFLEAALLTDRVGLTTLAPAEYERDPRVGNTMAVVIFDDYTPSALPAAPRGFLFVHPSGPNSPVALGREVRDPRITAVDEAHPVMKWIDAAKLGETNFDTSSVFAPSASRGESALASSGADAIIVAKRDGHQKIVALGFSLPTTDFPMRVAFPLLLMNALDWFAAD